MLLNLSFEYEKLSELENKLDGLPPLHRVAFATSICERLLPNYSAFARFGQANPSVLRNALDEVWQILQGKSADAETISQLIKDCSGLPPQEGDCETYVYEASMTIAAIRYTLEACLDPTPQQVAKVAEVAGDILLEFIFIEKQDTDPNWGTEMSYLEQKKEIASHPFVVREKAKQNEDFQQLKEVETLDRDFLEWLCTSFDNCGKSLLDLS